jgi:hypothetical protein
VEPLDAARVRAAGRQDLHLVRDPLALGDRAEVLDEPRVGDGVAVHDLDRGALAELGDGVLVAPARHVHGERDVERDDDRGRQGGAARLGAAQAHLLLRGRHREDRRLLLLQCPQGLDHHEHPDAVVHRLAHVVVAHPLQRAVHRYVVAHAHHFFDLVGAHAEVHEEVIRFRRFLLFAPR